MTFLGSCALVLALAGCAVVPSTQAEVLDDLVVVNKADRSIHLVRSQHAKVSLSVKTAIYPHEVAVSRDGRFAFVPIYGSGGVGKPGSNGDRVEIIDLHTGAIDSISLRRGVRPHDIKAGPDGFLYVTAELAEAIFVIDPVAKEILFEIPTGRPESHNLILSPDGRTAYTSNVGSGTVSILDIPSRKLVSVIAVAQKIQRLSISPDGKRIFTHPQDQAQVAVIDAVSMSVVDRYPLPRPGYASVATPDGNTLVVAGVAADAADPNGEGEVYFVDLASRSVTTTTVPGRPKVVLMNRDGSVVWADLANTGRVVGIDMASRTVRHVFQLQAGLDGMSSRAARP